MLTRTLFASLAFLVSGCLTLEVPQGDGGTGDGGTGAADSGTHLLADAGTEPCQNNFAFLEGKPCLTENEQCGNDCKTISPGQSCNYYLTCKSGKWTYTEVSLPPTCFPAQPLTTVSQLATLAQSQGFTPIGPYSSEILSVSPDLNVQGALTFNASDLPAPANCVSRMDCRNSVGFVARRNLPGVTLSTPTNMGDFQTVTLTDTTVRFRFILRDRHPSMYNFIPVVELIDACNTPCDAKELKCSHDQVCYSSQSDEYCRLCLVKDNRECACWKPLGAASEGTRCSWAMSGDAYCEGSCQAGTCQATPAQTACR